MNGSPSSIITLGYGTGTFAGSPSLVVTLGYGVGAAVAGGAGGPYYFPAQAPQKTKAIRKRRDEEPTFLKPRITDEADDVAALVLLGMFD